MSPKDTNGKLIFDDDIDYIETWKGMEECKAQGLARSIGISNFNSEQIERLMPVAKIKPANNQVLKKCLLKSVDSLRQYDDIFVYSSIF